MALSKNDRVLHRVGVIGDIHSEDQVLALVLRHFLSLSTDTILSVGDVVDGLGDVNKACALLRKHNVFTVSGNHERWALADSMRNLPDATPESALASEARAWLQQLPKTRIFQTPMGPLLLCHGLGENDMATVRPHHEGYAIEANLELQKLLKSKQYRFVVSGHSHEPMVRNIGKLTLINAGTLDRHDRQVCSVIDFEQRCIEFFNISQGTVAGAERYTFDA